VLGELRIKSRRPTTTLAEDFKQNLSIRGAGGFVQYESEEGIVAVVRLDMAEDLQGESLYFLLG